MLEFRSLPEPPCRLKPGWPPLPVMGSGKSLIRWERMHPANPRYWFSSCACLAGVSAEAAFGTRPADDELTLAALFELPHAAARKASPAEATIAAAARV